MKIDSQNKAEKFWDRTASNYDKEEKKDKKTYLQIIERTKSYLKSADIVLDLGCGTGLVSNEISEYVKKIDAIDLSSKMIEIAKTKAEKRDIQNIEYSQATVFDDSLKLASYDVILCFYIIHLLDDPQAVMRKIKELLKPDGILISVTPCMGEKPIQRGVFSILSRIGIIPEISLFKRFDLERLFAIGSFSIIENECLSQTSHQYFIVSKK
jgi:2-polyprenyl-3-methyl-5-hydroxy-6-metoxy-1,4-benzoquinol methylase